MSTKLIDELNRAIAREKKKAAEARGKKKRKKATRKKATRKKATRKKATRKRPTKKKATRKKAAKRKLPKNRRYMIRMRDGKWRFASAARYKSHKGKKKVVQLD